MIGPSLLTVVCNFWASLVLDENSYQKPWCLYYFKIDISNYNLCHETLLKFGGWNLENHQWFIKFTKAFSTKHLHYTVHNWVLFLYDSVYTYICTSDYVCTHTNYSTDQGSFAGWRAACQAQTMPQANIWADAEVLVQDSQGQTEISSNTYQPPKCNELFM